ETDRIQSGYQPPRNEREAILCSIFQNVLKLERVGINNNFFDIGCDSISAMLVVAAANKAGLPLKVRDMFYKQTVADLLSFTPGVNGNSSGILALSNYQQWFISRQIDPVNAYQVVAFSLGKNFGSSECQKACQSLGEALPLISMQLDREKKCLRIQQQPTYVAPFIKQSTHTGEINEVLESLLRECLSAGEYGCFNGLLTWNTQTYFLTFAHKAILPAHNLKSFEYLCLKTLQAQEKGIAVVNHWPNVTHQPVLTEYLFKPDEDLLQNAFKMSVAEYMVSLLFEVCYECLDDGFCLDFLYDTSSFNNLPIKTTSPDDNKRNGKDIVLTKDDTHQLSGNKKLVKKWIFDFLTNHVRVQNCTHTKHTEKPRLCVQFFSSDETYNTQESYYLEKENHIADLSFKIFLYKDVVKILIQSNGKNPDAKYTSLIARNYIEKLNLIEKVCRQHIDFNECRKKLLIVERKYSDGLTLMEVI
ncbi:MAG: phosphopantetheine-binding protein, partial [Pseudomonadota bacterium]